MSPNRLRLRTAGDSCKQQPSSLLSNIILLIIYCVCSPDKALHDAMASSIISPMMQVDNNGSNHQKVAKQQQKSTSNNTNDSTSTSKGGNSSSSSSTNIIKWPPASSTKSLPSISGRIFDLLHHTAAARVGGSNDALDKVKSHHALRSRDTIEFEVNQECKSVFT